MSAITFHPRRELLKHTTTRCPQCLQPVPGEVWREGTNPARVVIKRTCPSHGFSEATLASDARFYWISQGDPANACCRSANPIQPDTGTLGRNATGHSNSPFEVLSTCIALIEIVRSCNLSCPTCYAESPVGIGNAVDAIPLNELKTRIQGVVDRKGGIEILQLSGGESTLHPQLSANDFMPLPCGDPNCATIGYLLRINGTIRSVSEFLDFSQLQGFLQNKIQYRLEDFAQCGCEIEPLGAVLLGYTSATGDWFAQSVPLGIAVGRLGCWFKGCCLGQMCQEPHWWTLRDTIGIHRWPSVPVEFGFNLAAWSTLMILKRAGQFPGNLFHLYLIAYGLFRFAHEFVRDTPRIVGPFSGYALVALALAAFGLIRFRTRQRAQPPC
jgi:hypothetical protein